MVKIMSDVKGEDEKGADGIWDLAGYIADSVVNIINENANGFSSYKRRSALAEELQDSIYDILRAYKEE